MNDIFNAIFDNIFKEVNTNESSIFYFFIPNEK